MVKRGHWFSSNKSLFCRQCISLLLGRAFLHKRNMWPKKKTKEKATILRGGLVYRIMFGPLFLARSPSLDGPSALREFWSFLVVEDFGSLLSFPGTLPSCHFWIACRAVWRSGSGVRQHPAPTKGRGTTVPPDELERPLKMYCVKNKSSQIIQVKTSFWTLLQVFPFGLPGSNCFILSNTYYSQRKRGRKKYCRHSTPCVSKV